MRVLVTGAGGFLGGALARRLGGRRGVELALTARRPSMAFPNVRPLDLAQAAPLAEAIAQIRPDVVIHAAGRAYGEPAAIRYDNVEATAGLVAALAAAAPNARLLLLASGAAYGPSETRKPWRETDPCAPAGPYAEAKQEAETLALAEAGRAGMAATSLRLFNVVAAAPHGQSVFDSFLRRAAGALAAPAPRRVAMGPLGAVRDFVALAEVLTAVERVLEREVWGETINVCTGHGRLVRALVEAAAARLPAKLVIDEEDGPEGLGWSVGDPAKCARLLGLTPSAELGAVLQGAADWVVATARDNARSQPLTAPASPSSRP